MKDAKTFAHWSGRCSKSCVTAYMQAAVCEKNRKNIFIRIVQLDGMEKNSSGIFDSVLSGNRHINFFQIHRCHTASYLLLIPLRLFISRIVTSKLFAFIALIQFFFMDIREKLMIGCGPLLPRRMIQLYGKINIKYY